MKTLEQENTELVKALRDCVRLADRFPATDPNGERVRHPAVEFAQKLLAEYNQNHQWKP